MNVCTNGVTEHVELLVKRGIMPILLGLIEEFRDSKTLMNILETVLLILKRGEKIELEENPFLKVFDSLGGLQKFEELQKHPNKGIFKKVNEILDRFFEDKFEI